MFKYIHYIAYVVSDMDEAVRVFRDIFELELSDRRVIELFQSHYHGDHLAEADPQK